jgi:hypothetical protein
MTFEKSVVIGHWSLFIRHWDLFGAWFLVTLAASVALIGGCSSSTSGPPVVPAEGTVLLDDKPLPNANVMLVPKGETRGDRASFGKTDATGKFAVASPDGKRKGTAVGSYQVVINKLVKPDGSDFVPGPNAGPEDTGGFKELLPVTYSDPAQSMLTTEVPAGGTKGLEFKLRSKRK